MYKDKSINNATIQVKFLEKLVLPSFKTTNTQVNHFRESSLSLLVVRILSKESKPNKFLEIQLGEFGTHVHRSRSISTFIYTFPRLHNIYVILPNLKVLRNLASNCSCLSENEAIKLSSLFPFRKEKYEFCCF